MASNNTVYLPDQAEVEQVKISSRTLSKYADADRVSLSLKGSNGESDDLVLPGQLIQILLDVLSEISKGNAISLVPHHQELSTQEAANLLNVSRPFLVNLLKDDEIPYRKVGSHRRVRLQDLLEYKEKIDRKRLDSFSSLAELSQEKTWGTELS